MNKNPFWAVLALVLPILPLLEKQAVAQDYPSRAISLVVPIAPGGPSDVMARVFAKRVEVILKQPMVVVNVPGASGAIGTARVAKAQPNGYEILLSVMPAMTQMPVLDPTISYDPIKDLSPVIHLYENQYLMIARPDFSAKSVPELIALARRNPGSVKYGTPGERSSIDIALKAFQKAASVEMIDVPYRGEQPSLVDLMGGQVDFVIASLIGSSQLVDTKRVIPLAAAVSTRLPQYPALPTVSESGVPFDLQIWSGIHAPANTPAPIVNKLSAAFKEAFDDPEIVEFMKKSGLKPGGAGPAQFGEFVRNDFERWKRVLGQPAQAR